jgi:predicted DNA binding CopG/RHH family protein
MKRIPKFKNEEEERKFWASADSTRYVDWSQGQRKKFPNLAPSLKTISLRLPAAMIEDLKTIAHRRDVPYQSLLKIFLAERIEQEHRRA